MLFFQRIRSYGIHRHFSPPFGRVFLDFFPGIRLPANPRYTLPKTSKTNGSNSIDWEYDPSIFKGQTGRQLSGFYGQFGRKRFMDSN